MTNYKGILGTPRESWPGTSSCEFVVLHHTGTGNNTIKGVLDGLYRRPDYASCHYVIDENGDVYKIGVDTDRLWHAGVSEWTDVITGKKYTDLNRYSIGIEIIGPVDGGFTDAQRESVEDLILDLSEIHNIPTKRILRHKDIAPGRKTDPADTLWNTKFKTYDAWIDSIFYISPFIMEKFTKALEEEQKKSPNIKILSNFTGDQPLTEKETRQLIEIGLIRLARLFGKK